MMINSALASSRPRTRRKFSLPNIFFGGSGHDFRNMADAGRSSLRFDLSDSEIERRSGHSSGSYPGNGSSPALSPRRASSPQGPGPGHSKQAATSSPTLANLNQPLSSRFSIGKGKDPAAKKVKDKKKGLGSSSSSPTQARICLNE